MASLKDIRNRISSIKSTQQITRAMKMVAAAKLRKAQDRIIQMRPYSFKLREILNNLSASLDSGSLNIPYFEKREVQKVLIVNITGDKGLCGSFNSYVNKKTINLIDEKYAGLNKNKKVDIICIGKKGGEYLKKYGYPVIETYDSLFSDLSFENVEAIADKLLKAYADKEYDAIYLNYNKFKNAVVYLTSSDKYLPVDETVLELKTEEETAEKKDTFSRQNNYIFEPSVEDIIKELIPKSLKISIYSALLESNAAEQGARMTAMDQATENAEDLIKDLRILFNKERQASITTELSEIVSGARALEGN